MKLVINSDNIVKLTLKEARKYDNGTLFKLYNNNGNLAGVAVVGKSPSDTVCHRYMVHMYEGLGTCLIFEKDPPYPFSYELMEKDASVTLVQK